MVAFAALAVSFVSLAFTLYWHSPFGEIRPLEPSGYAVIRGMSMEQGIGRFPSDHLVFPMQWKNTSGRPAIIQQPTLILHEISEGEETGTVLTFTLAGEYTNISTESFSKRYVHKNSFLIDPHSVSLNTLVFHHKYFWRDDNADFRFAAHDEYQVSIKYIKNSGLGSILQRILGRYADGEKTERLAKSLKHKTSLNNLKLRDDLTRSEDQPWWDYWEELTF
jgi:hypothetical protein